MAVLVSDSFNRADSTTTLGTTDSYNGGTTKIWTPRSGHVWGIKSNQAYAITNIDPTYATVDAGTSDVTITVTIPLYKDSYAFMLRVNPANNTGLLFNTTGKKLQSFSGNIYTTIAAGSGNSPDGAVIKVTAQGSTIAVWENGVQILTATSSLNQTSTNHGMGSWRGNTTATVGTWDNFIIEDVSTGGTTQTGASSVQGVSTITADATVIGAITGSASLQGVATLAATATVLNAPMLGSAALQGISTLTATGNKVQTGGASLTGVATSTAFAEGLTVLGGASLSGVGVLTASGVSGASIARAISLFGSLPSPIALLGESVAAIHLQASWTSAVSLFGSKPEPIALEGGLMTKTKQDFTMYAGDTPPFTFTMADSTSLSGATVKWAMRKGNVKGTQVLLKTTSNGLTVSGTVATISLLNADTLSLEGQYYHEAEVTDVSGNVSTVMTGTVTITPSGV